MPVSKCFKQVQTWIKARIGKESSNKFRQKFCSLDLLIWMDMGGRPQEHQQPSRDPDFSSPACLVVVVPLRRCVNYSSTHGCKKDWRWLKFRFWFRTTMVTTTKPLFSPVFGVRFWRGKHLLQGLVSQAFSAGGCRSPQATSNSLKTWIKKKKHNSFPIFTRDPQGELLSNHDSMMVTQVALFFFYFFTPALCLPCGLEFPAQKD